MRTLKGKAKTCEGCKFWRGFMAYVHGVAAGHCYRYPPTRDQQATRKTGWCGEWRPARRRGNRRRGW